MKKNTSTKPGTIRFKVKDLKPYEKTKTSWKKSSKNFPEAEKVITLFKKHNNINSLIDTKNSKFLKGEITNKGKIKGARINILPTGEKLTGAYSLFANDLTIHDQNSHDHWDVIYKNPSGYCYLYNEEKIKKHKNKKYSKVKEFEKLYPALKKIVENALNDETDYMAIPIYTLLKTYMRVGNEIYYKLHGHKGLTTLTKNDIKIKKDKVIFNYIAKDGVPMTIETEFPKVYIKRLKKIMKNEPYIFQAPNGKILTESHFKKAFKKYIGEEFYPHIVRSFFATHETKEFLKNHKKPTKKEVQELLTTIAHYLGHRKFDKKNNEWKDSYSVTIRSYIEPKLAEKLTKIK